MHRPLHNIEYILDAEDGKTSEQHERDIQDVLTRATNLSKVIDLQVLGIHVTAPISKIIADLVRSYSSKWNQIAFNNCCGEAGQDLIKAALEHSNSVVFHSRRAMVSENRFCDTVFGLYDRGSLFRLWGWILAHNNDNHAINRLIKRNVGFGDSCCFPFFFSFVRGVVVLVIIGDWHC